MRALSYSSSYYTTTVSLPWMRLTSTVKYNGSPSGTLLCSCNTDWFTFREMFPALIHGFSWGTGDLLEGEEQRIAEIPRPQTAAVTNLLLSHCFHGDGGAVLLSCKVEGRYRRWGEGLGRRSRWWVERRGNVREEKGNLEEDCCCCWNSGNTRRPDVRVC